MATDRTIFTNLDRKSFDLGLRWVRSTKQTGLTLLVIDLGLEEEQVDKLKDLGVKIVPNNKKTGVEQVDIFNTFLAHTRDTGAGTYLFWDMETKTESVAALWGSSLFAAPLLKEANIPTLVFPLTTIDARVLLGSRLESELVEVIGSGYYSGLMSGRLDDWKLFVGLYNTLIETGSVESLIPARNIVLNLFALYFAGHIEPKPLEYEISALQPEN